MRSINLTTEEVEESPCGCFPAEACTECFSSKQEEESQSKINAIEERMEKFRGCFRPASYQTTISNADGDLPALSPIPLPSLPSLPSLAPWWFGRKE